MSALDGRTCHGHVWYGVGLCPACGGDGRPYVSPIKPVRSTRERLDAAFAEIRQRGRRIFGEEVALQDLIATVFTEHEITFDRERSIGKAARPDFMAGTTAIEVKIGHGAQALVRQLARYAENPAVSGVVLITNRRRLEAACPESLCNKRIRVVRIETL